MVFVRPCILMAGRGSGGPSWLKGWELGNTHGELVWDHPLCISSPLPCPWSWFLFEFVCSVTFCSPAVQLVTTARAWDEAGTAPESLLTSSVARAALGRLTNAASLRGTHCQSLHLG